MIHLLNFLTDLSKFKESSSHISYKNILKFMKKVIVITLQKNIADIIINNNNLLNRNVDLEHDVDNLEDNFNLYIDDKLF